MNVSLKSLDGVQLKGLAAKLTILYNCKYCIEKFQKYITFNLRHEDNIILGNTHHLIGERARQH